MSQRRKETWVGQVSSGRVCSVCEIPAGLELDATQHKDLAACLEAAKSVIEDKKELIEVLSSLVVGHHDLQTMNEHARLLLGYECPLCKEAHFPDILMHGGYYG